MAFPYSQTKHSRHRLFILMLCCPLLSPWSCSSLFPGGTLKLFKETAAFSISSFILTALLIPRNFRTSTSLKSFSVSLHLNDLIILKNMTNDVMRQGRPIFSLKLVSTSTIVWQYNSCEDYRCRRVYQTKPNNPGISAHDNHHSRILCIELKLIIIYPSG